MHLTTCYNGVEIHRADKIIYARFLEPHLVISTCRAAGGIQKGIGYVLNSQGCEPTNHLRNHSIKDPLKQRRLTCAPHGLPPEKCVTMGTAANMHHAALVKKSFRGLEVMAVVTGGVETNAGRAGDPAAYMESTSGFEKLKTDDLPGPGTINTMLFINQPLTEGALTRTIMTATEAKCAALQELNINSRYSDGLATGTGTDQIVVAAPEREGYHLTSAGKHSKLGELIGRAVKKAVKETLGHQNRLTAVGQGTVKIHLERFGCSNQSLKEGICTFLNDEDAEIMADNYKNMSRDPLTVAAIAALVHLKDKLAWGILPKSCRQEVLGAAAAQVACAVSGRYEKMAEYRAALSRFAETDNNDLFLKLCERALAAGFADKWRDAEELSLAD